MSLGADYSMAIIVVKAAYDPDACVWFVESSDLPGLNVEASTVELLQQKLPLAIADLLEAAGEVDFDVPVEIITHSSVRVRRLALT